MESWIEERDPKISDENRERFSVYYRSLLANKAISQSQTNDQPNHFFGDTPVILGFVEQPGLDNITQDNTEQ